MRSMRLFWPELIVIGGGVSEDYDQFGPLLRSRAQLRPARLGAAAGVVGAAMAAPGGAAGIRRRACPSASCPMWARRSSR